MFIVRLVLLVVCVGYCVFVCTTLFCLGAMIWLVLVTFVLFVWCCIMVVALVCIVGGLVLFCSWLLCLILFSLLVWVWCFW